MSATVDKTAPVAVLGGGAWGITLAWLAARAGRPVRLWSSNTKKRKRLETSRNTGATSAIELPDAVEITGDLGHALEAQAVVLAVQPDHVRELLASASQHFRPEQRVVHAVKGFERGGMPVSHVIEQETCVIQTGAVGGPVVPAELWRGEQCGAVVGSRFQAVIDEVTSLLSGPHVRVYGSRDLVGVEVGGAMHTPMAIAAGLLSGAGMGRALQAVLLTRGIAEGARLTEALGGDRRTLAGLSGIGDWMLTAGDPNDPLVKAGSDRVKGKAWKQVEAASRVATLLGLAEERGVEMPITSAVGAILDGQPIERAMADLMTRAARSEVD